MNVANLKKEAKTLSIDSIIIATHALKYGVHFSNEMTKCFINGASTMAGQLVGTAPKIGLSDFLAKETEKSLNTFFSSLLKYENLIKTNIR